MKSPTCTVLLPVYNGEKYLREAIDSVLAQTYKNFELLIINDGSTDKTDAIIRSYNDARIRYIQNKTNLKLIITLNKGIRMAKGKYIARMDADDLSHPKRLAKQIAFLDTHPDYGLVGSLFALIDTNREIHEIGGAKLLEDEDLKMGMLFANIFCHGETMFRKKLCIKHNLFYDQQYTYTEDYELWTRMAKYTKIKNLPEVLYFYMTNPQGISAHVVDHMQKKAKVVRELYQKRIGFPIITPQFLVRLLQNGRVYKDDYLDVQGRPLFAYLQLAYQVYLYRLAFIYLRRGRLDGLGLLPVSFCINPINWGRHVFGGFTKTQQERI